MVRKRMLNKRTVIVASSLAAIPLTAMIIATAIHRRRRKSLETSRFSGQTRSKANVITTTAAVIDRQQEKEKSHAQLQPSSQGSETKAAAMTTTAATISTNTTIATKDITTPAAVVPSPMGPSGNPDSAVITQSSYQTPEEEEISVSDEAKKSGESLKELIVTAVKEAKDSARGTGKRLREQTINIAATTDSKDIHTLGDNVNALVGLFEETMIEIRKERYDQQIKLLDSYKDLLQKHNKVIDARGRMARKLKPGA